MFSLTPLRCAVPLILDLRGRQFLGWWATGLRLEGRASIGRTYLSNVSAYGSKYGNLIRELFWLFRNEKLFFFALADVLPQTNLYSKKDMK